MIMVNPQQQDAIRYKMVKKADPAVRRTFNSIIVGVWFSHMYRGLVFTDSKKEVNLPTVSALKPRLTYQRVLKYNTLTIAKAVTVSKCRIRPHLCHFPCLPFSFARTWSYGQISQTLYFPSCSPGKNDYLRRWFDTRTPLYKFWETSPHVCP